MARKEEESLLDIIKAKKLGLNVPAPASSPTPIAPAASSTSARKSKTGRVAAPPPKTLPKLGVAMVVDADRRLTIAIGASLRNLDFEVVGAEDGMTALCLSAAEMPVTVIVDNNLPDMSSLLFCKRLRALPGGDQPAVFLALPVVNEPVRNECQAAGASGVAAKPVHIPSLMNQIKEKVNYEALLQARKKVLAKTNEEQPMAAKPSDQQPPDQAGA